MSLFKQNQAVNELSLDLPQKSPPESPTTISTAELIASVHNEVLMKNVGDSAPILVAANGADHLLTASEVKEIGIVTAAIEGPVTAVGQDGVSRILNKDDSVYLYDTIATRAESYVKVTLNDGTVFQLGPDSRAKMDKYVYEPEDEFIDEFETYVYSGSFRYVSGKISGDNQGQHTVIKTPSAHIGIRGSEIDARVDNEGSTTVLHLSGLVTITSRHHFKEVMVYERGTSVYIPNEKASHSLDLLSEEHIELKNQHWQVFDRVHSSENLPESGGQQNTYSLQSTSQKTEAEQKISGNADDDVGAHNPFSPAKTDVHDNESVDDLISEHEAHEHREGMKNQAHDDHYEESKMAGKQKESVGHERMEFDKAYVTDDSNGVLPHDNETMRPDDGSVAPGDGDSSTGEGDGSSMDGEGDPTDGEGTPTDGEGDSTDGDGTPTDGEGDSTDGDGTPIDEETDDTVLELTLAEDQSHTFDLPIEGGKISELIQPRQGEVVDNLEGSLIYTPAAHFNGEDSFSYILNGTTQVIVNLTILPVNDSPVAQDDIAAIQEDSALLLPAETLFQNDEEVDEGDELSLVSVQENALTQGRAFQNDDGDLVYLPNPNFYGQAVVGYTLQDSEGVRDSARLTIRVAPVNDAPIATNDFIPFNQEGVLTLSTASLLTNDQDVENEILNVIKVFDAKGGTVNLNEEQITFSPNPDFIQGGFNYSVSDGKDISTAQVIINRQTVAPIAQDDGPFDMANQPSLLIRAADLLKNDNDPDGEVLRVIEIRSSQNGEAKLDANGDVVFTKGPTFEGQGEFEYQISDGRGGVDTARVTVIDENINQPPVAQEDGPFDLAQRDSISIKTADLLKNDADSDGDPLRVVDITKSENGEAKLDEEGNVVFTRGPDFEGQGEFEYQISDNQGGFDTARVTVIGDEPNQPPIAQEDGPFDLDNSDSIIIKTADLLKNDRDPEGEPLRVIEITNSVNGQARLDENGDIVFTRGPDFEGQGEFEYQISDNQGGFDTARVTVIGNLPPIARDDGPQDVIKNQMVVLSFEALLANDADPNPGDTFTLTALKNPINGEVNRAGTNNIIFTPTPDITGEARFEYVITDNHGASATAVYQMNIINTPPLARPDSFTTLADTPVLISAETLLSNDFDANGDPLVVIGVNTPDKGTVNPVENDWLFTPEKGFKGDIQFDYTIKDSSDGQATATVTVTVTDSPLIARDDPSPDDVSLITAKNTEALIPAASLLSNDEGEGLTITAVDNASNAGVELELNGDITFTPDLNYTGNATFDYTLTDANGNTDQATVTVIVENSPPVADADSATTPQNVVLTIPVADLLANDSDPDPNETLTLTAVNNANKGSVELNDKGTAELEDDEVVFTPALDFIGEASFEYTISDSSAATATSTVDISVKVNEPPLITLPNASSPLLYNTLGKKAQPIDPNATIIDEDSPDFEGGRLEVLIAKNRSPNDTLEIQNLGPISVSSHTGGVISFNSLPIGQFFINLITGALVANLNTAATPESTTALLQAITYKNTSPTPSTEPRTIQMSLTDGDGGTSELVSREIEVIVTNVAPVATDDTLSKPFNSYTTIPLSDLLANDSDANPGDILKISEISNVSKGVEATIEGNEVQLFIDALISNFEETTFDYTLNDGKEGEDNATVFIKPSNVIPGTAGDDNLEGTDNLDIILGKAGNDTFEPSVGPDMLLGGEDDDLFLFDPNTATGTQINGNQGTDTLSLTTANQILDLLQNRTLPEAQKFNLQGIEKIDMNTHSEGNNQIRLSVNDVLEISDTNRLMIDGDGSSLVNSTGQGWRNEGIDSTGLYNRYTSGEAELLISVDIASQFIS